MSEIDEFMISLGTVKEVLQGTLVKFHEFLDSKHHERFELNPKISSELKKTLGEHKDLVKVTLEAYAFQIISLITSAAETVLKEDQDKEEELVVEDASQIAPAIAKKYDTEVVLSRRAKRQLKRLQKKEDQKK